VTSFSVGSHDDQVDALGGAYAYVPEHPSTELIGPVDLDDDGPSCWTGADPDWGDGGSDWDDDGDLDSF
jgi:hypothetical protein